MLTLNRNLCWAIPLKVICIAFRFDDRLFFRQHRCVDTVFCAVRFGIAYRIEPQPYLPARIAAAGPAHQGVRAKGADRLEL